MSTDHEFMKSPLFKHYLEKLGLCELLIFEMQKEKQTTTKQVQILEHIIADQAATINELKQVLACPIPAERHLN